jgi:hypothetical protein
VGQKSSAVTVSFLSCWVVSFPDLTPVNSFLWATWSLWFIYTDEPRNMKNWVEKIQTECVKITSNILQEVKRPITVHVPECLEITGSQFAYFMYIHCNPMGCNFRPTWYYPVVLGLGWRLFRWVGHQQLFHCRSPVLICSSSSVVFRLNLQRCNGQKVEPQVMQLNDHTDWLKIITLLSDEKLLHCTSLVYEWFVTYVWSSTLLFAILDPLLNI